MPPRPVEVVHRELHHVTVDRLDTSRSQRSIQLHGSPGKVVRMPPPRRAPYCAYRKLQQDKVRNVKALEKLAQNPYFTSWELVMQDEAERRAKFINGPFVVTDHRAAVAKREVAMMASTQPPGQRS
jgi:hypothetical protein